MLPTQEAVEKWMQVRDQDVNVNKNLDLESCVIVPVNEMKSLTQEVFLPLQNRQSSCLPREDNNYENSWDARTVAFKKNGEENRKL